MGNMVGETKQKDKKANPKPNSQAACPYCGSQMTYFPEDDIANYVCHNCFSMFTSDFYESLTEKDKEEMRNSFLETMNFRVTQKLNNAVKEINQKQAETLPVMASKPKRFPKQKTTLENYLCSKKKPEKQP